MFDAYISLKLYNMSFLTHSGIGRHSVWLQELTEQRYHLLELHDLDGWVIVPFLEVVQPMDNAEFDKTEVIFERTVFEGLDIFSFFHTFNCLFREAVGVLLVAS